MQNQQRFGIQVRMRVRPDAAAGRGYCSFEIFLPFRSKNLNQYRFPVQMNFRLTILPTAISLPDSWLNLQEATPAPYRVKVCA